MKSRKFFISCLIDIIFAAILIVLVWGVFSIVKSLRDSDNENYQQIKQVDNKVDNLSSRLSNLENQVKLLGCNIKTKVATDGTVLIELKNVVDEDGNIIDLKQTRDLSNYCSSKIQKIYQTVEDVRAISEFNYNYVRYLSSQDYIQYQVYEGGIVLTSFEATSNIYLIEIPDKIDGLRISTIGPEFLKDNRNVREVKLPISIVNIESRAFNSCTVLRKVEFYYPDGYTGIPTLELKGYAFYNCVGLNEIDLSHCVRLDNNALQRCEALSELDLSNLNYVGADVFVGCSKLKKIILSDAMQEVNRDGWGLPENCEIVYTNNSVGAE